MAVRRVEQMSQFIKTHDVEKKKLPSAVKQLIESIQGPAPETIIKLGTQTAAIKSTQREERKKYWESHDCKSLSKKERLNLKVRIK
jgi:hypothetical protein